MIFRPYKKIQELEKEICNLTEDKRYFENKLKELRGQIEREEKGLHNPSILCLGCSNCLTTGYSYYCKLDCKCKDRKDD